MQIKKINIDEYGSLTKREFILSEGLNIFEGHNESGKSTILSFIRFMLYGMPRKSSGSVTERDRGISWGNGVAGGSMVVSVPDKNGEIREYRIERHGQLRGAAGHENYAEALKIIDLATGTEVFDGQEPGKALLGISQEAFVSTALIRQLECADVDGAGVNASIENLLFAANEGVNTEKAMGKLDDFRKTLLHKNEKGGLIFELEAQKTVLEEKLQHAKEQAETIVAKEAAVEAAKALESQLSAELRDGENAANLYEACAILQRFDELHQKEEQQAELQRELETLGKQKGYHGELPTRETVANVESLLQELSETTATATLSDADLAKAKNASDGDRALATHADTIEAEGGKDTLLSRFRHLEKVSRKYKGGSTVSLLCGIVLTLLGALGVLLGLSFQTPLVNAAVLIDITTAVQDLLLPLFGGSTLWYLVATGGLGVIGIVLVIFGILLSVWKKKAFLARRTLAEGIGADGNCSAEALEAHMEACFANREACHTYDEGVAKATGLTEACHSALDACVQKGCALIGKFGISVDTPSPASASEGLKNTVAKLSSLVREKEQTENEISQLSAIVSSLSNSLRDYSENTLRSAIGNTRIQEILDTCDIEKLKNANRYQKEQLSAATAKRISLEKEQIALAAAAENPAKIAAKLDEVAAKLSESRFRYHSIIMAMESIETASDNLRRSVTPRIREKAGTMMGLITDGKYSELGVSADMTVSIFAGNSTRSIDVLSKGTKDAAYLSLRIALADLVCPGHPLPLTMDEGLSLLDETRAKRVLTLLNEYAKNGGQCILFTCHKREGELMKTVGPFHHIVLP